MFLNKRHRSCLLIILPIIIFFSHGWLHSVVVEASESRQVIVHKRQSNGQLLDNTGAQKTEAELSGTTPQNNVRLNVFEISDYFGQVRAQDKRMTLVDTQRKIAAEVLADMKQQKPLTHYGELLTGCPKVTGDSEYGPGTVPLTFEKNGHYGNQQAYLIVDEQLNGAQTSQPLVLLPFAQKSESDPLHVYTKDVALDDLDIREPYFYKHGQTTGGTDLGPLAGAQFHLYKQVDTEKYYLHQEQLDGKNIWQKTNAAEYAVFTSAADGKVNLGSYHLPAGTYIFEEVTAPDGYEITAAASHVQVVIPEELDQPIQITIAGQTTAPDQARVFNLKKSGKPTEPTKPESGETVTNQLESYPLTGEKSSLIWIICGLSLIGTTILLKKYFF